MRAENKIIDYLKRAYSLNNTVLKSYNDKKGIIFEITKGNIVQIAQMIQREELKNEKREV